MDKKGAWLNIGELKSDRGALYKTSQNVISQRREFNFVFIFFQTLEQNLLCKLSQFL